MIIFLKLNNLLGQQIKRIWRNCVISAVQHVLFAGILRNLSYCITA